MWGLRSQPGVSPLHRPKFSGYGYTIDSARSIFPDTQITDAIPAIVQSFNHLSAEDQLALLWFVYTEMGMTITPTAMQVANMVFAETTLPQIRQMPPLQQT
ncbi:MAG: hypothetical protein MUF72_20640 [Elainella sp. Prado103]|nr:hypothetical protein [Elainella sp. Prado103]